MTLATVIRAELPGLNKRKHPSELRCILWWLLPDLNWGHKALQASALPTELKSHIGYRYDYTNMVYIAHSASSALRLYAFHA